MLEKSFGLFFFLKQPKNQKNEERYVYLRITVDRTSKELSLKRTWPSDRWNQTTGKAIGNKEDARNLNTYLDSLSAKVYQAKLTLLDQNKSLTAENLKDAITGQDGAKFQFLEILKIHNERVEGLIGKGYKYRTLQRYKTPKVRIKYHKKGITTIPPYHTCTGQEGRELPLMLQAVTHGS